MILSMDIAWRHLGWVVWNNEQVVDAGVIRTEAPTKKGGVRVADHNAMLAATIARELKGIVGRHNVKAALGELPSGGALSAKAMQQMGMATATVGATLELLEVPSEWVTPNDVKLAATGLRGASKEDMMAAACDKIPGFMRDGKAFMVNGVGKFCKGDFEHIADAAFVYEAARGSNLRKIFGRG